MQFSSSAYTSAKFSKVSAFTASIAAYFSNFFLSDDNAAYILSVANSLTAFSNSGSIEASSTSTFSFPISSRIFSWNSHSILICSCPNINAPNISFSDTCLAPASTIQIASLVPATVK